MTKITSLVIFSSILFCFSHAGHFLLETSSSMETEKSGLDYEGIIKSIESTDDGQYAVVEFIGYANQECIWLQDLLKSNGEEARQKQNKEATWRNMGITFLRRIFWKKRI